MSDIVLPTHEDEVRIGERIAALLTDPAVDGVFTRLRDEYVAQWRAATDPATREAAWLKDAALAAFRLELQRIADAGTFAAAMDDARS